MGLAAALLLAACSRDLGGGGQTGSGGSLSTGGAGGAAGTSPGGTGGAPAYPTCPTGTVTFSVCIVNDADMLPLEGDGGVAGERHDLVMAAAATVEAVGAGAAPAQCQSARVFGAPTTSDWWLQVRTADTRLWTIGVGGLGNTVAIKTGDSVTLDLVYQYTPAGGFWQMPAAISGHLQLSDAAGTPLLWAGLNSFNSGTWLSLTSGQPVCDQRTGSCPSTRYDVKATINGSVATVAPFSATSLAGYHVAVGEYAVVRQIIHTECAFMGPPALAAAALKMP